MNLFCAFRKKGAHAKYSSQVETATLFQTDAAQIIAQNWRMSYSSKTIIEIY